MLKSFSNFTGLKKVSAVLAGCIKQGEKIFFKWKVLWNYGERGSVRKRDKGA